MSTIRTRWAAVGAAVAITLGAGGIGLVSATNPGDAVAFVPITPCRVMDTRTEFNVGPKTSPVGPGEVYTVNTTTGNTGNCSGIPTTATGVSLNITALDATAPTFITVWATGDAQPEASSLNPVPGAPPTPNAVTTGISAGGQFDLYNLQGNVQVIADINGYYTSHDHDDRYYTKSQANERYYTKADVDSAIATATSDWVVNIPLGSIAVQFGTDYNTGNFAGPVGIEILESSASIAGTVGVPAAYDPSTGLRINVDLMPGDGSTAPCTVDLDVTSGDTQRSRPGAIRYSLLRDTQPLDVTLDPLVPVRAYVSFDASNGFEPGDTLAFRISRDHDDADTCTGDVVVTGMSLTPDVD